MVKSAVGNRFAFLFFFAVGLAGCAPLQQAPLVYSSKTIVGIDISSPTSEQPGVSLSLGFKNLDAAYVPVAVAKPCEKPKGGASVPDGAVNYKQLDCENSIYKMEIVGGSVDKSNGKSEHSSGEHSDSPVDAPVVAPVVAQLIEQDKRLDELSRSASTDAEKANIKKKKENIRELLLKITNVRGDSYSVFGSFDSKTTANEKIPEKTTGMGVTLGKVFSTGIAAQNLTDGLKDQYGALGRAEEQRACLAEGRKLLSDYQEAAKESFDLTVYSELAKLVADSCKKPAVIADESDVKSHDTKGDSDENAEPSPVAESDKE